MLFERISRPSHRVVRTFGVLLMLGDAFVFDAGWSNPWLDFVELRKVGLGHPHLGATRRNYTAPEVTV